MKLCREYNEPGWPTVHWHCRLGHQHASQVTAWACERRLPTIALLLMAVAVLGLCARSSALVWMAEGVHVVPTGAAEKPVRGMPAVYYANKGRPQAEWTPTWWVSPGAGR